MMNSPATVNGVTVTTPQGGGIGSGSGSGTGNGMSITSSSDPRKISSGVINGSAVNLATPAYPAAASSVRANGSVNVQVTIDENGNVIAAQAVSGHPLLRQSAEDAARKSKFKPTLLSGKPVQKTGVIVYNFQNGLADGVQNPQEKPIETLVVTEPEEQSPAYKLKQKLYFWIYDLVERLQKGVTKPTANEAKFVKGNTAYLQIQLTEKTSDVVNKLEKIGFDISSEKNGKVFLGKIKTEKIKDLVEIKQVKYILPQIR